MAVQKMIVDWRWFGLRCEIEYSRAEMESGMVQSLLGERKQSPAVCKRRG